MHAIRQHFRDLFESGELRRNLLTEISKGFFGDLNIVLQEYILLQKAKITDPASSGKGKENLSSNYLVSLNWSPPVEAELKALNDRLMGFRAKIDDARRKYLAHADLSSHLAQTKLGDFSEAEEQDFWSALQDFVNIAHEATFGGPYPIDAVQVDGDVQSLMHALVGAADYSDLVENEEGFLYRRFVKQRYKNA